MVGRGGWAQDRATTGLETLRLALSPVHFFSAAAQSIAIISPLW